MPRTTKRPPFDASDWKRTPGLCTRALASQFLNLSLMIEGLAELVDQAQARDRAKRSRRKALSARRAR